MGERVRGAPWHIYMYRCKPRSASHASCTVPELLRMRRQLGGSFAHPVRLCCSDRHEPRISHWLYVIRASKVQYVVEG